MTSTMKTDNTRRGAIGRAGARTLAVALLCAITAAGAGAQQSRPREAFRLGLLGGASYTTITERIENLIAVPGEPGLASSEWPAANGIALYGGAFADIPLGARLALHLRATYDARNVSSASAGRELAAHLDYLAFEPGLRIDIGGGGFHIIAGPSGAFALKRTFDFTPADGEAASTIAGRELAGARDAAFGLWGELGYDLRLTSAESAQAWYLTPFAGGSYLLDQVGSAPSGASWNSASLR
jgi:hypothetical protein